MNKYNLGYISDEDIYNHIKATVGCFHRDLFRHIGNGWKSEGCLRKVCGVLQEVLTN